VVELALPPIAFLLLLGVSQSAVVLMNWLVSLLVTPKPLPRMDFSKGIPPISPDVGGGADDAHQPGERRATGRGA
jgi:hypothetical protein